MQTYTGSKHQGKWYVFPSSPTLGTLRSESIDSTLLNCFLKWKLWVHQVGWHCLSPGWLELCFYFHGKGASLQVCHVECSWIVVRWQWQLNTKRVGSVGSQVLAAFRILQIETYSRDAIMSPVPEMGYKPQHCLWVSPSKCPCPLPGMFTRVAQICGGEGGRNPPPSLPRVQPAFISRMKRVFWCLFSPHLYTSSL